MSSLGDFYQTVIKYLRKKQYQLSINYFRRQRRKFSSVHFEASRTLTKIPTDPWSSCTRRKRALGQTALRDSIHMKF